MINANDIVKGIPYDELVERLKPGNSSEAGFLGENEDLVDVINADIRVVESFGTTYAEIADILEKALRTGAPNSDYVIEMPLASLGAQECPWHCREHYAPGVKMGYVAKKGTDEMNLFADLLEKETEGEPLVGYHANKLSIVTELHPHLIRAHMFFEGRKSIYRADPELLIRALNLVR